MVINNFCSKDLVLRPSTSTLNLIIEDICTDHHFQVSEFPFMCENVVIVDTRRIVCEMI